MEAQVKSDSRRKKASWIILAVALYVVYVMMFFYMEARGREEFKVPSKADIGALDGRVAQVKAETARGLAMAEMSEWGPYATFTMVTGIIILGGTFLLTVLGPRVLWSGINRNSMGAVRNMVIGVLLIALFSIGLLFWPQVVAERLEEKKFTDHLDGVTLTAEPGN